MPNKITRGLTESLHLRDAEGLVQLIGWQIMPLLHALKNAWNDSMGLVSTGSEDGNMNAEVQFYLVDATDGPVVLTLPDPSTSLMQFTVKKLDGSANGVTVLPFNGERVEGTVGKALTTQYEVAHFVSDGRDWWLV